MSIESRKILEAAKKFQEEARQAMIANRKDSDGGNGVDTERAKRAAAIARLGQSA